MDRRFFIQTLSTMAMQLPCWANTSSANAVIVVVGGGIGGCAVAIQLKQRLPKARIILVEKNNHYFADFYNNMALIDEIPLTDLSFSYDAIRRLGIEWVQAEAVSIEQKQVVLQDQRIDFDFAVVATGIGFDHRQLLDGVTPSQLTKVPHAMNGKQSAVALKQKLQALKDGDAVAFVPPPSPSRCTPAVYSRVGLFAHYMQQHLPNSKIIIFDSKNKFPLQTFFDDGWTSHYGDKIEWLANEAGGLIEAIDVNNNVIHTEFGEEKMALINYIPPQYAGQFATNSGLTDDSGWCPVNANSMESIQQNAVYVIGDAVSTRMPKAASCAIGQANVAAQAIISAIGDSGNTTPSNIDLINYVCYSHIAPNYAFWEQGNYSFSNERFKLQDQAFSQRHPTPEQAEQAANDGYDFFSNKVTALFGI